MAEEDLSAPDSPEELYEATQDVPLYIPFHQGDVFADLIFPGYSEEPSLGMLVMHPCSLRAGPRLRARVTVAPVKNFSEKISDRTWSRHTYGILLPNLTGPGQNSVVDFREVTSIASDLLAPTARVATLSLEGRLILQQRIVYYHSRFIASIDKLSEAGSDVATELELQERWVEAAADRAGFSELDPASLPLIDESTHEFHEWLNVDDARRRKMLGELRSHASLRRELAEELRKRR